MRILCKRLLLRIYENITKYSTRARHRSYVFSRERQNSTFVRLVLRTSGNSVIMRSRRIRRCSRSMWRHAVLSFMRGGGITQSVVQAQWIQVLSPISRPSRRADPFAVRLLDLSIRSFQSLLDLKDHMYRRWRWRDPPDIRCPGCRVYKIRAPSLLGSAAPCDYVTFAYLIRSLRCG